MLVATKEVFDRIAFRRTLGQFPTGVCVVTTVASAERLGMTVSSFNSLSLDPPLILFSIDRKARSLPLWEEAEAYAVNVLAENQSDVSDRFARPFSNKWEGARLAGDGSESPVLSGVAAVFECAPWAKYDGGDHRLFVAEVTRFWTSAERKPLVFCKGHCAKIEATDFAAPLWPLDIHY
jgi:flavin reductase (DIM6/NTAB) family NADH-FMN oxidoreductase RutF